MPALDPPASCSRLYGFFVWSVIDEDENQPAAKSHIDVLAKRTAPESLSFAIRVASRTGTYVANSSEPNVVRIPADSAWSFTRTGTPWSGPMRDPVEAKKASR